MSGWLHFFFKSRIFVYKQKPSCCHLDHLLHVLPTRNVYWSIWPKVMSHVVVMSIWMVIIPLIQVQSRLHLHTVHVCIINWVSFSQCFGISFLLLYAHLIEVMVFYILRLFITYFEVWVVCTISLHNYSISHKSVWLFHSPVIANNILLCIFLYKCLHVNSIASDFFKRGRFFSVEVTICKTQYYNPFIP